MPKVKKIYVWTNLVRPGRRVYEFDFTDSTWWTLSNAQISWGKITWNSNVWWSWEYDMGDITGANSIIIDATVYGNTWSWVWLIELNRWKQEDWNNWRTWMMVNYMTNGGYNNSPLKLAQSENYTQDYILWTTTKYWSWIEMPVHCEFDFVNKTGTMSFNNTLIGTANLTDAQITTFRNTANSSFRVWGGNYSWYVSYLKVQIS